MNLQSGPSLSLFASTLLASGAPVHSESMLHIGISLLRLMQPIPLEERNRHNAPADCRQQPITQAGVPEWLERVGASGEV